MKVGKLSKKKQSKEKKRFQPERQKLEIQPGRKDPEPNKTKVQER